MSKRSLAALVTGLTCWALSTVAHGQLTGIWQDNNGTRYAVRQDDDELYWWMAGGEQVQNVFYGTLVGTLITGEWVDLPGGRTLGSGTLAIELRTPDLMVRVGGRGNYGASEWRRIPVFTQSTGSPTSRPGPSQPPSGGGDVFHFRGPAHPLPGPPDLRGVLQPDQLALDATNSDQASPRITEMRLRTDSGHPPALLCGSPSLLDIVIKNDGSLPTESGSIWYALSATMTNYVYDEVTGTWTFVEEDLYRNAGSEKVLPTLQPSAETEERLVISPLANPFTVRAVLFREQYAGGRLVRMPVDTISRTFRKTGPDLGSVRGKILRERSRQSATAWIELANKGDLAPTAELVSVTLRARQKEGHENLPMVIWHLKVPSPDPGQRFNNLEDGATAAYLGDPDWTTVEVEIDWPCKQDTTVSITGMDKDRRDNRFITRLWNE